MKNIFQAAHSIFARKFFVVVSLIAAVFLSGCANIIKGTKDTLHVSVTNCGEPISCDARNEKGAWEFVAPGSAQFLKSENPLTISCQDGDELLTRAITPTPGGWIWLNILFLPAGLFGMLIDATSDAHWNMTDSVSLHRTYCRGQKTGQ